MFSPSFHDICHNWYNKKNIVHIGGGGFRWGWTKSINMFFVYITKSHKLLPIHQWKIFAHILDGELIVIRV